MWAAYVRGYLDGKLAPNGAASRVFIARQEDILRSPGLVVAELARLGLPRNDVVFGIIETLQTGYQNEPRQDILRRENGVLLNIQEAIQSAVIDRLEACRCARHMRALGYCMPVRH